mgnify:CR=1 FL=1
MSAAAVLLVDDLDFRVLANFCSRFGVTLQKTADAEPIEGSFWGAPEAGIVGTCLYVRNDTPVHSLLHELGHIICATAERRGSLHTNAGSDDAEEAAVCYLQILLADSVADIGRARIMADMDAWGYSFPEGATSLWFANAGESLAWLADNRITDSGGGLCFRLRS